MDNISNKLPPSPRKIPDSVYFYTFHKCASTLFSRYVLKNIDDLIHIDYASQIYRGIETEEKLTFDNKGYIYGPIRLSADHMSPVYRRLVAPTSDPLFIKDKIAIFFVRDPRDILISKYYSFGFTHGLSSVKEIRERELSLREEIQQQTLDQYVLENAQSVATDFSQLDMLAKQCKRSTILKYEDMIDDFDCFISQLTQHISLDDKVVQEIYVQSRPIKEEDLSSHRRSGKVANFRSKLKGETIDSLNKKLESTLELFGYSV